MFQSLMITLALAGQCYNTPYGRVCSTQTDRAPAPAPASTTTAPTTQPAPYPSATTVPAPAYPYPIAGWWVWDGSRWNYYPSR